MDWFTIIGMAVLLFILYRLLKRFSFLTRRLRNSFREFTGKEPAEMVKAREILQGYCKNDLIPKFAVDDAIKAMSRYYTKDSSVSAVIGDLKSGGVYSADIPRSLYKKPGTQRSELIQTCAEHFGKYSRKILQDKTALSNKEKEDYNNLAYMLYFADDSIQTLEEARKQLAFFYEAYLVKEKGTVS